MKFLLNPSFKPAKTPNYKVVGFAILHQVTRLVFGFEPCVANGVLMPISAGTEPWPRPAWACPAAPPVYGRRRSASPRCSPCPQAAPPLPGPPHRPRVATTLPCTVGRMPTRRRIGNHRGTRPLPVTALPPCLSSLRDFRRPAGGRRPLGDTPSPQDRRDARRQRGHLTTTSPSASATMPRSYPLPRVFRRQRCPTATPMTPWPSSPLCHRPPHPATSPQPSMATDPSIPYK